MRPLGFDHAVLLPSALPRLSCLLQRCCCPSAQATSYKYIKEEKLAILSVLLDVGMEIWVSPPSRVWRCSGEGRQSLNPVCGVGKIPIWTTKKRIGSVERPHNACPLPRPPPRLGEPPVIASVLLKRMRGGFSENLPPPSPHPPARGQPALSSVQFLPPSFGHNKNV